MEYQNGDQITSIDVYQNDKIITNKFMFNNDDDNNIPS